MTFAVSPDGQVEYLMKAGKDVVKSRTLEGNVRRMIEQATTKEITDEYKGFPLCVNGKFYFPEVPEPPKPETRRRGTRKKR